VYYSELSRRMWCACACALVVGLVVGLLLVVLVMMPLLMMVVMLRLMREPAPLEWNVGPVLRLLRR
jgi:hypothetical protein